MKVGQYSQGATGGAWTGHEYEWNMTPGLTKTMNTTLHGGGRSDGCVELPRSPL